MNCYSSELANKKTHPAAAVEHGSTTYKVHLLFIRKAVLCSTYRSEVNHKASPRFTLNCDHPDDTFDTYMVGSR